MQLPQHQMHPARIAAVFQQAVHRPAQRSASQPAPCCCMQALAAYQQAQKLAPDNKEVVLKVRTLNRLVKASHKDSKPKPPVSGTCMATHVRACQQRVRWHHQHGSATYIRLCCCGVDLGGDGGVVYGTGSTGPAAVAVPGRPRPPEAAVVALHPLLPPAVRRCCQRGACDSCCYQDHAAASWHAACNSHDAHAAPHTRRSLTPQQQAGPRSRLARRCWPLPRPRYRSRAQALRLRCTSCQVGFVAAAQLLHWLVSGPRSMPHCPPACLNVRHAQTPTGPCMGSPTHAASNCMNRMQAH